MARLQAALFLALVAQCQAVTWVKSAGGVNCDHTCAARSGCSEDDWPSSEEEFHTVAKLAGQVCEGTQSGGAKYDPSTDGRYCGWSGPDNMEGESRCSQAGDSQTYRFCPCNSDKEL
eukprot:gb/GFBE01040068.1/.p1 GENE.gb/GFBE01040068.1/~~gb/GFBE01040068.1/.p1  ORF type:complete len:117 (+),score=28.02 gb/GFBE01040068.1/:1-351(+)